MDKIVLTGLHFYGYHAVCLKKNAMASPFTSTWYWKRTWNGPARPTT